MKKDKVIEAVKELPQDFDLDKFIERLIFIDKVEKGLQELHTGETKTHDEAKRIIKSWQK